MVQYVTLMSKQIDLKTFLSMYTNDLNKEKQRKKTYLKLLVTQSLLSLEDIGTHIDPVVFHKWFSENHFHPRCL